MEKSTFQMFIFMKQLNNNIKFFNFDLILFKKIIYLQKFYFHVS